MQHFDEKTLFKHVEILDQVEIRMLHHFASVAEQVMVKELLFHFALQEGLHCLFEIWLIALLDEEVQFVTVVVWEVPVFLIRTQSVPLFDEVEDAELTGICSFYFSDFTQNLRHFSQVINNLNLGRSDVFNEVLLFRI